MSIAQFERALIDFLSSSALRAHLRQVESLPDLEGKALVDRFATDAPAIYVAHSDSVVRSGTVIQRRFGIAAVARNARGHYAARHGDGQSIGLYEMIGAIESMTHGSVIGDTAWRVTADRYIKSDLMFRAGLYGAVINIETDAPIADPVDINTLHDFVTYTGTHDTDDVSRAGQDTITLETL